MVGGLKWLAAGLLIGVAVTLLVSSFAGSDPDLPERIAENLGCSDGAEGVHPSSAAAAHHAFDGPNGYSWFAATHANRVLGINGCDPVGPATRYLEFDDGTNMSHVLATLDHFGAVCVVGHSVFEGRLLNGLSQFEHLCEAVSGDLKTVRRGRA